MINKTKQTVHIIRVLKDDREVYVNENILGNFGLRLKDVRSPKGKVMKAKMLSTEDYQYVGTAKGQTNKPTNITKEINKPLADIDLPGNAIKALINAGYETLLSMIDVTDEELSNIPGIGDKTIEDIRELISNG